MAIATEQILVELLADTSQLESAIEQLARTSAIDAQMASAFKSTTAEINKQASAISSVNSTLSKQNDQSKTAASIIKNVSVELGKEATALKSISENAKPAATTLEQLAVSSKNLSRDMAAGLQEGIKEALDEAGISIDQFKQKLNGVQGNAAFDALNKSLAQTAVRAAETASKIEQLKASGDQGSVGLVKLQQQLQADEAELKKIEDEISKLQATGDPFKGVGAGADNAGKSTASLRAQLRTLTEQIVQAKLSGQDIGAEYEALVAKAGKLKDSISDVNQEISNTASDTSNIDGLIGAAQGIAGAFSLAQGATALFGTESEELQSALVKLNAIMAITQGLQAVGNTLQKESAASRLLDSVATKAQVAGQRLYAVVVGQSTGALKAFRIALASTGIGLLIIALGALVANWDKVKESINGVTEAQKENAETADLNADQAEEMLEAMEGQEEVLKRQGQTEEQILQAKIKQVEQVIEFRQQQLEAQSEMARAQVEASERNKKILAGIINFLTLPLKGLQLAINKIAEFVGSDFRLPNIGESVSSLIFDPDEAREEGEKTLAETQKQIDKLKNQKAGFENNLTAKEKEEAKKRADAAKAANEQRLKDVISNTEAELLAVKKGSDKELELQKKLLTAKANLDLNGAKSAAERRLIAEKLNADLTQLDVDFQNTRTQIRIKGIQDELEVVEEGSQKELQLRKQLLDEQAALELNNLNLNDAERERIEKKRFNDKLKLERDFNKKLAAEAIQNQIAVNNAEIQRLQDGNEEKLLLQLSNIELAAEAEVESANGNAAKIKEIYANRDAAIRDAKIAFIDQAVQHEIETLAVLEAAQRRALGKTVDDGRARFNDRIEAVKELSGIEISEIDKLIAANEEKRRIDKENEQKYTEEYNRLVDQRTQKEEEAADKIKGLEDEKNAARLKVAFAAAQAIADTFSMIADFQAAKDEERIAGMKKILQDEIDAGAITEKEAGARAKRIEAEEKKARIKAAERAKQIAIFNSIINTAQAVVQALASAPPPFNFVLAGIVGAMGLAQTALIASKPIPKFKTGKKHLYEGPAEVAEDNRPEIIERKGKKYLVENKSVVWLGKQDKVYTNRESMQMLEKSDTTHIQKIIANKPSYVVNKLAMQPINGKDNGWKELKEEIQTLQKIIKNKSGVSINIDKEGITEYFEKTMSEIHYINNRYTSRGK